MAESLYLRPTAIASASSAPKGALPLAGGPLAFAACEVAWRDASGPIRREVVTSAELLDWARRQAPEFEEDAALQLERLSAPRSAFAGLAMDRPRVMAVINVTPDSFSDGGERFDHGKAVADGQAMREAGAAILDVGGESTRPGSEPVSEAEELRRVIPVVRELADSGACVSIDSRCARVIAAALDAGARIINDVTALTGDPESLLVAARSEAPVVLMHMQGEPRTMQAEPKYDDPALDIYDWLAARLAACEAVGITRDRLAIDPGIGFGKTVAHNVQILDHLALFHGLGCPLVLGVSRKSFIGRLSRSEPPRLRVAGSLAAALAGLERSVQIVRVHDVAETVQAIEIWRAISSGGSQRPPVTA